MEILFEGTVCCCVAYCAEAISLMWFLGLVFELLAIKLISRPNMFEVIYELKVLYLIIFIQ